MTSPEFDRWVEKARAIPIENIARDARLSLKRQGKELVGPCPRCSGDDRFWLNPTTNMFGCRQCPGENGKCAGGQGAIDFGTFLWGDDIRFLALVEKLTGEPRPGKLNGKSNGASHEGTAPWLTEGEWVYLDADEKPYLKVVRKRKPDGDKSYPQFHMEGGKWVAGKPSGSKIPYRLPALLDADRTEPMWITEGEKCADRLAKEGFAVTTASEGAGKWTADLNQYFAGRIVWILPDEDEPGRRHAQQVAAHLHGVASEVRIVEIPGLKDGQDVHDFLDGSGTAEQLRQWAEEAPLWVPTADSPPLSDDTPSIVITLAEFLAKYDPPDYLVEGLLQRHFLYSLTGMTGGGKTAIATLLAVLVALRKSGQKFGSHAVKHGRVVYIAAENETDVQMRFPPLLTRFSVEAADLDILVIDQVIDLEKDFARIDRKIREFGGADLVFVDTSPRLFFGDNINDDTQMLKHAVRLRGLTRLPGKPCVVALGHPIKRPAKPDELLPKGGGAYLNEVDGNLTLWKHDGNLTDLHWAGKFRGPDFAPVTFRLEVVYSTANVDKSGKLLPTVMASHVTDAEAEAVEVSAIEQEHQLLAAVQADRRGSLTTWAKACGWFVAGNRDQPNKQQAQRIAQRLTTTTPKLLTKNGRGYALTKAGKDVLKDKENDANAEPETPSETP